MAEAFKLQVFSVGEQTRSLQILAPRGAGGWVRLSTRTTLNWRGTFPINVFARPGQRSRSAGGFDREAKFWRPLIIQHRRTTYWSNQLRTSAGDGTG